MDADANDLDYGTMVEPLTYMRVVFIPPCSVEAEQQLTSIDDRHSTKKDKELDPADRISQLYILGKTIEEENWLTDGLVDEIQSLFPPRDEIDSTDNNTRDPLAFKAKASKLFCVAHIFTSSRQLEQAATMFLNAWAVTRDFSSKSIQCFYGKPTFRKINRLHEDGSKRRRQETTLKDLYQ